MKDAVKAELKIWPQYIALAALAGLIHFIGEFGGIPGINVKEAWRNYEPLLSQWLVLFVSLSAVRLLLVLLAGRPGRHSARY